MKNVVGQSTQIEGISLSQIIDPYVKIRRNVLLLSRKTPSLQREPFLTMFLPTAPHYSLPRFYANYFE